MQPKEDHPLVGTWIVNSEDSDAEFTFSVKDGRFAVSGISQKDGEAFEIRDLLWNGKVLSFTARMPSTNFISKNRYSLRDDGSADLELTIFEVWKKRA